MTHATTPVLSSLETLTYIQRVEELLSAPRIDHRTGEVTHPHSWIQNREAITHDQQSCDPKSDLACAYCMIGAVRAVTPDEESYKYVISIINAANPTVIRAASGKQGGIPNVNDRATSFERVIKMLQKTQTFIQRHLVNDSYI